MVYIHYTVFKKVSVTSHVIFYDIIRADFIILIKYKWGIYMFDVMTYYLSNGFRVMLHRENQSRVVKVGVIVNQGSSNEMDDNNGISHFIEHMVFSQYENDKRMKNYVSELYTYGASYNATTYRGHTMYHISGLADGIRLYLKVLRDLVYCRSEFTEDTLNLEKQVVEREASTFYSSFNQIADRGVQALYGEKSIGRIILGKKNCIKNFTIEQITKKLSETYTPENSAIVVFGDIDYYEIQNVIEELYGNIKDTKTIQTHESVQQTPSIYFNPNHSGDNAVITVCYKKVSSVERIFIQNVLSLLLCALCDPTISDKIAHKLRMKTGLSYTINGFLKNLNNLYASGITAVSKASDAVKVIRIMVEGITDMRDNGFTEEELIRIKKNLIFRKLYSRMDMTTQAEILLSMAMEPSIYSPENEIRIVENLNLYDVNECIKDILNPTNLGLACIGKCDIDELVKAFTE